MNLHTCIQTSLEIVLMGIIFFTNAVTSVRPRMDNDVHNVTVIEGHEAILPCVVNNLGRHQVKVIWQDKWKTVLTLNDRRIIDDERFKVDNPRDGHWNLHFDKVKYGDQGLFICQINTDPPLIQTVILSVIVPPRILSEPNENTLIFREGEKVTLTCNATGMPKPTVTWYRKSSVKGEPTDSESCTPFPRIGTAGEILNIYNITRHCGGVYECEADNGVTPIATKATTVKVKFPPEVKVASDTISQAIGKDTILECTVTGYPHGEAFWEFGFKRLFTSEKYMSEASSYIEEEQKLSIYLTIKNIQSSDFGEYFCFASNDMGHARDKMVLEEYKEKKKTTPALISTTSSYHYLNSRANQPHNQIKEISPYKSKGRTGVSLEKNELINGQSDKRKLPTSRPEASLQILGHNTGQKSQLLWTFYITLSIIWFTLIYQNCLNV
ncbi:opioid-binding protein/cell adhesion molecule homolog isoform X1 [Biomphalaria glabrata]|uniref:Opioid-binding protein/cell adhesion molecule homolog isoform X1 n=1 Tax=Biomphalaria glabrata TaxID=6526 RepID=A0A9W3BG70_BIOGL|nr:opioid-binding protein/cell adhesion molecule homolog isoform X1 [Biomphalaria glabrata]